jgi:hypothetical protein
MPYLFTLLRELRDIVIDFVLASPSKTPHANSQSDEQPRECWNDIVQMPTDRSASRTTSYGLLTANMQLSCETTQRIRSKRCKPTHQLDVMLVGGKELRPTWINIPSLKNTKIENLEVTFRDFSGSTDDYSLYLAWTMYSSLYRFLHCGPTTGLFTEHKSAKQQCSKKGKSTTMVEEKDEDKMTMVKHLHINVEAPPLTGEEKLSPSGLTVRHSFTPLRLSIKLETSQR